MLAILFLVLRHVHRGVEASLFGFQPHQWALVVRAFRPTILSLLVVGTIAAAQGNLVQISGMTGLVPVLIIMVALSSLCFKNPHQVFRFVPSLQFLVVETCFRVLYCTGAPATRPGASLTSVNKVSARVPVDFLELSRNIPDWLEEHFLLFTIEKHQAD